MQNQIKSVHSPGLTDNVFTRLIAASISGIILCVICLVSLTWAWFSDDIQTEYMMNSANYYLQIEVYNTDNEMIAEGPAMLSIPNLQGGQYEIKLTGKGTSALNAGYAYVDLGHPLNAESEGEYVPQMNRTEIIDIGEEYTFTLFLTDYTDLNFTQVWGENESVPIYSLGGEIGTIVNGDYIEEVPPPPPPKPEKADDSSKSGETSVVTDENGSVVTDESIEENTELNVGESTTEEASTEEASTEESFESEEETSAEEVTVEEDTTVEEPAETEDISFEEETSIEEAFTEKEQTEEVSSNDGIITEDALSEISKSEESVYEEFPVEEEIEEAPSESEAQTEADTQAQEEAPVEETPVEESISEEGSPAEEPAPEPQTEEIPE